jgi:hypothetical protein
VVEECWHKRREVNTPKFAAAAVECDNLSFAFAVAEMPRQLSTSPEGTTFPNDVWVFDTGASHMTPHADRIIDSCPTDIEITVGNGTRLPATEIGTAMVSTLLADGSTRDNALQNTLVVPSLLFSLMSWSRMADAGAAKSGDRKGTKVFLDK